MRLDDEEIGAQLGWSFATITIILGIVALLGAATNSILFDFLKNFQVLIGATVAAAVGFIAYVGATATAREHRRKSIAELEQIRITHCIRLMVEIQAIYSWRATVLQSSVQIQKDYSVTRCASFSNFVQGQKLPCLDAAFANVGVFPQLLRNSISLAWSEFASLQDLSTGLVGAGAAADEEHRKRMCRASAIAVLAFSRALSSVSSDLKPFLKAYEAREHTLDDYRSKQLSDAERALADALI